MTIENSPQPVQVQLFAGAAVAVQTYTQRLRDTFFECCERCPTAAGIGTARTGPFCNCPDAAHYMPLDVFKRVVKRRDRSLYDAIGVVGMEKWGEKLTSEQDESDESKKLEFEVRKQYKKDVKYTCANNFIYDWSIKPEMLSLVGDHRTGRVQAQKRGEQRTRPTTTTTSSGLAGAKKPRPGATDTISGHRQ